MYGQLMLELDAVKNIVQSLETGIIRFEDSMSTGEDYMWIIPGLLFAVSLLTACAMLGVLLAWKDKSGTRVQNIMSYFVLPLLIVVSGACWVAVSVTSVGTMLSAGTYFLKRLLLLTTFLPLLSHSSPTCITCSISNCNKPHQLLYRLMHSRRFLRFSRRYNTRGTSNS